MAMSAFPHHPDNHPYTPDNSPISPTTSRLNHRSSQQAKGAALMTVDKQLTHAQTLIARSRSIPPLTDEQLVAPLPSPSQLPRMAADRRRPKAMDLDSPNSPKEAETSNAQADAHADKQAQKPWATRRARIASMPPKQNTQKVANERGRRPFMLGGMKRSRPANADVEAGIGPIGKRDRYVRFWNTLRRREKAWMGFLFLLCILAAVGLLGLVMYVKRPRSL